MCTGQTHATVIYIHSNNQSFCGHTAFTANKRHRCVYNWMWLISVFFHLGCTQKALYFHYPHLFCYAIRQLCVWSTIKTMQIQPRDFSNLKDFGHGCWCQRGWMEYCAFRGGKTECCRKQKHIPYAAILWVEMPG